MRPPMPSIYRHITICFLSSVILAFAYGLIANDYIPFDLPLLARAALKASAIVLFAALAFTHKAPLLAAALTLGAIGDFLLALGTEESFFAGAFAFLLGHLVYITLFLRNGPGLTALQQPPRIVALLALLTTTISLSLWLESLAPEIDWTPHRIYTIVLTLMVAASFTLPAPRWPVMLGAVLFLISDALLFYIGIRSTPDAAATQALHLACWMTYWAAQAAICLGALTLRRAA